MAAKCRTADLTRVCRRCGVGQRREVLQGGLCRGCYALIKYGRSEVREAVAPCHGQPESRRGILLASVDWDGPAGWKGGGDE